MKSDYTEIGGRYVKSPVLIAGVPSPSPSCFYIPLPLPNNMPATQAKTSDAGKLKINFNLQGIQQLVR